MSIELVAIPTAARPGARSHHAAVASELDGTPVIAVFAALLTPQQERSDGETALPRTAPATGWIRTEAADSGGL